MTLEKLQRRDFQLRLQVPAESPQLQELAVHRLHQKLPANRSRKANDPKGGSLPPLDSGGPPRNAAGGAPAAAEAALFRIQKAGKGQGEKDIKNQE